MFSIWKYEGMKMFEVPMSRFRKLENFPISHASDDLIPPSSHSRHLLLPKAKSFVIIEYYYIILLWLSIAYIRMCLTTYRNSITPIALWQDFLMFLILRKVDALFWHYLKAIPELQWMPSRALFLLQEMLRAILTLLSQLLLHDLHCITQPWSAIRI